MFGDFHGDLEHIMDDRGNGFYGGDDAVRGARPLIVTTNDDGTCIWVHISCYCTTVPLLNPTYTEI